MITLTLPLPPSANVYWRNNWKQKRVYVSDEAKAYKDVVGWKAREAGLEPITGSVGYVIRFYFSRKNGDASNRIKVLEDSLNGYAWIDDLQVIRGAFERHMDLKNPRVEIDIYPIEGA